jgi:ABC-type nitrate/sulfonate/bicarbonate transport system substrate-binding protein
VPAFAAEQGGYLKQYQIESQIAHFPGGQVESAFAAGQCDFLFGAGGLGPLIQGLDVVMVAATTNVPQFQIWGRPQLQTIADLEGHSVGTSGAGSQSWRLARYYLRANGLVPDEGVAVLNTGAGPSTLGALFSGRVDAAMLAGTARFEARAQGFTLLYKAPPSMQAVNTGLVTTQRFLTAHRDIVRDMVKGISETISRLQADEAFYGAALSEFTKSALEPALIREYWLATAEHLSLPPRATHEGAVLALVLYLDEDHQQDVDALARRWIDMSIVDELYPSGVSR